MSTEKAFTFRLIAMMAVSRTMEGNFSKIPFL